MSRSTLKRALAASTQRARSCLDARRSRAVPSGSRKLVTFRNSLPARSFMSSLNPAGSANSAAAPFASHTTLTDSTWILRKVTG